MNPTASAGSRGRRDESACSHRDAIRRYRTAAWQAAAAGCRRHYLEWAGELCARAYEPVRSGSLEALAEQAQALKAAEVIQQWPFQQRRLAQIAALVGTVVSFVITGIITRLIQVRFGL